MNQHIWVVVCPHCETDNQIERALVRVECGQANATCTCKHCGNQFSAKRDYLEWLGVDPMSQDIL